MCLISKRSVLPSLLLLLPLLASAYAPQDGPVTGQSTRTLRATGVGEISVTPDIARVSINLSSEEKTAREAVSTNNDRAQEIIDILRTTGVAEEDIKTTGFNIYPRQLYGPNREDLGKVYVVSMTLTATVRDLNRVGEVLDPIVSTNSELSFSMYLDISDASTPFAGALAAAVSDAREKALIMAEAAQVELGALLRLETFVGGVPILNAESGVDRFAEAQIPIAPGQSKVSTQVIAIYEIR